MSSNVIQSLLEGEKSLYLAEFLCEFCFGGKLIYFIEKKTRTYPQRPIEFLCLHCESQTTNPLQRHHRTKELNVKKIEDTIIISLLANPTRDKSNREQSDCDKSEVVFFGAGKTIQEAQSALIKRYDLSELTEYLIEESE